MKRLMVSVVFGMISSAAMLSACDDGGAGQATPVAVSLGQLSSVLADGPARVEVQLSSGGAVRELHASSELGHDEHLQGVVVAMDLQARVLELADIGVVSWSASTRLRVPGESRASEAEWQAALEVARAGGAVVVRASRPEPVGGPQLDGFVATDLRIEDGRDERARLELLVGPDALDADAGVLTVFGLAHDLSQAQLFDDDGLDGPEVGDDDGVDGPEVGDDDGVDAPETGDDNGVDAPETGDDNGGHGGGGGEAGDDTGGHGADA